MNFIKANGDCDILRDGCPHCEQEEPCNDCSLATEFNKYRRMIKERNSRISEDISYSAEQIEELIVALSTNAEDDILPWQIK